MTESELLKDVKTMTQNIQVLSEMTNTEEIKNGNYSAPDYTAGWQAALKLVSSYLDRVIETEYTRKGE